MLSGLRPLVRWRWVLLGKRVIVLDAAVLLEAQWTDAVNEIWIASIPLKEVRPWTETLRDSIATFSQAIQRTVNRDHLTLDDAKRRVNAQMSNQTRFSHANVLLCTYWPENVTQKQVECAWQLLMQRIDT